MTFLFGREKGAQKDGARANRQKIAHSIAEHSQEGGATKANNIE